MTAVEGASILFGAMGVGGAAVAVYIRATIAETIIQKLDDRYMSTTLCGERHSNLTQQLLKIEHQAEKIDRKVDFGFDAVRTQLLAAQLARDSIVKEQIHREHPEQERDQS